MTTIDNKETIVKAICLRLDKLYEDLENLEKEDMGENNGIVKDND